MAERFMHTVLSPAVLEAERHYYGRTYETEDLPPEPDPLRARELNFIALRDSFYIATVTEDGWPYVQHRGGPPGFLCAPNERQLIFADYGGNRQLITVGSLSQKRRVSLFLMDYPNRQRLKILGHARVFDARQSPDLVDASAPPDGHAAPVERVFVIDVLSYDWNCPKFITARYTEPELGPLLQPLHAKIAELQSQLAQLQSGGTAG